MKTKTWVYLGIILVVIVGLFFLLKTPDYEIKGKGFDDAPAKVVIIEYADFQCPACGSVYPILKQIQETYTRDQVKIDYKHFPLKQIHPFAFKAAQGAECARDQDKFKEYHDVLFENQRDLRVSSLKAYASQVGLNTADFNACLDSNAMVSRVEGNIREGTTAGVRATPTFFIDSKKHEGVLGLDEFKEIIDAKLKA